ncbi:MAG: alpha/beta fold hydrolase [Deltaproteobacteria bacterium]|nr:alpha/beta fold hydrolase [Deltaproteobacteria bacterium]
MEQEIVIPGKEVFLEGRFLAGAEPGGVVITHPHPLYGGSMDNNIVWTVHQAFQARGWSTLRFNFRGVGRSTGSYGQGLAEVDDIGAALAFLKEHAAGPHLIAGYSFGAAVAARALLGGLEAAGAVLISPPIAFMDIAFLAQVPRLKLIIAGDRDDLCPLKALYTSLGSQRPEIDIMVIEEADHFYGGQEKKLWQILRDYPFDRDKPAS